MSDGNTCAAEPSLEVLPFDDSVNDQFSFFLLKVLNNDVKNDDTIRSVIVLLSDENDSTANRNLQS